MVIYNLANPESGLSSSLNFRLYLGPSFVNRLKFVKRVGGRPVREARQFAVSTGMESGADAFEISTCWRGFGRFQKNGLHDQRMIETVLFTTGYASTCLLPGGWFRTGNPGVPVRRAEPASDMGHRARFTNTRAALPGTGLPTTRTGWPREIRHGPGKSRFKKPPDSIPITCMRSGRSRQSRIRGSLLTGTAAGNRHKADRG